MVPFLAHCGGQFSALYKPQTISTPGYNTVKRYEINQECNWLISVKMHLL